MGIGNEDNFVFCLPDRSELSCSRVEIQLEMTEKHMLEDGIQTEHFTCHTLRHAFATRAIENGMKPHVLGDEKAQEMLLMEIGKLENMFMENLAM